MADVSLPSGPVMTELEKNPLAVLKNPITLWNVVPPFQDICYGCCINCVYYILRVFCATLI